MKLLLALFFASTALLHANTVFFDDFDPDYDASLWSAFGGTVTANTNGQAAGAGSTGKSLHFAGSGSRFATTIPLDLRGGAMVSFKIALADGPSFPWENVDPGEQVVLEYSLDGLNFVQFGGPYDNRTWEVYALEIPAAAQSAGSFIRWKQLQHSGNSFDHWALDDVSISTQAAPVTGLWTMGSNNFGQLGNGYTTGHPLPVQVASDVTQASAGASHSLFLMTDGTLWAMGNNSSGQLGDGTTMRRTLPVWVANDVIAASAGDFHSLFIKSNGSLWAMGSNGNGRLGDGTTISQSVPVQVATGVIDTSAGNSHSLFLKSDGSLWAMGSNGNGRLGDGTTTTRTSPVQVATGVAAASAGYSHSLFIKTDDSLWAMGANWDGQLGDGTTTSRTSPVQVASGVTAASAGYSHSLFIKTDDSLWAMGANWDGQLGDGTTTTRTSPVQVATDVIRAVAGNSNSWFVKSDDSLWGMGSGTLIDGTSTQRTSPVQITTGVADIALGSSHALFVGPDSGPIIIAPPEIENLTSDIEFAPGNIASLSVNASGPGPQYQWYSGVTGDTSEPVEGAVTASYVTPGVYAPSSYWVRVYNSGGHVDSATISISLVSPPPLSAGAWGVGSNNYGQLGDGSTMQRLSPVHIRSGGIASVSAGSEHSLLLMNNRGLRAMGLNTHGQLGDGTTTRRFSPTLVASEIVDCSAGNSHSLMIKEDGILWAMGRNNNGQLGDGTTTSRDSPAYIDNDVLAISAGSLYSLFLKADGSLWAMGRNNLGQLGDGSTSDKLVPVQIASGVASISAGTAHSLFLKTDGSLWAMGSNSVGQLGDGTTTNRPTPIQVSTGVVAISAGNGFSLFVKSDGALWAMGSNSAGQLGDGTLINRLLPVEITSGVAAVSAGGSFSTFLKTDGSLWTVGANPYGQLGDGSTTSRRWPVKIASGVASMSAGSTHLLFVTEQDGLPLIESHPVSMILPGSQVVEISVTATGENLSYQWYEGSEGDTSNPMIGATDPICNSPPLEVSTSFWVRVSSSNGYSDSLAAIFKILPRILSITQSRTATQNQVIKLASTTTDEAMEYQWYLGITGDTSDPITHATSPSYLTPPLQGVTNFWLRISNPAGHADSDTVTITVQSPDPLPTGLWARGRNTHGTLGDGTTINRNTPVLVGTDYVDMAAGLSHSLFIKKDGTLWAVGNNSHGQLGDGSTTNRLTPVLVDTNVSSMASGSAIFYGAHSLFIKTDNTLWAMGSNNLGKLGDGTTISRSSPVHVASGVRATAAGGGGSMFTKADGSLWIMGQVSGYTEILPRKIGDDVDFIDLGNGFDCFIKSDGTLWTRGDNQYGQLGDGSTTQRHLPQQISTDVAFVSASSINTLFIKADGTLWGMGSNDVGQLGDGTTINRTSPVLIATDVASASAGGGHSLFIKTDGTLWGMGSNNDGRLDDGEATNRPFPFQLASGISAMSAGSGYSLFISESAGSASMTVEAPSGTVVSSGSATLDFNASSPLSAGERTITIRNDGDGVLTGIFAMITGPNVAEFELVTSPPAFLDADASAQFTVRFAPTSPGEKSAILTITSSDSAKSPFTVNLAGLSESASIAVEAPTGTVVQNGTATLEFSQTTPLLSNDIFVTIRNEGNAILENIQAAITGSDAAEFEVVGIPSSSLAIGAAAQFTVRFAPNSSGNKTAILSISGSNAYQSPFVLELSGFSNHPPMFEGAAFYTGYESPLSIHLSAILAAASDADNDMLTVTTVGPVTTQGGSAVITADSILYTPPTGFTGQDSFSVTIADTHGAEANGVVTVSVAQLPLPSPGGPTNEVLVSFGATDIGGGWNIGSAAAMNSLTGLPLVDSRLNPTPYAIHGFGAFDPGMIFYDASHPAVNAQLGYDWNGGVQKSWIHPFAVNDFVWVDSTDIYAEYLFKISGLDPSKKYSLEILVAHSDFEREIGFAVNPFSNESLAARRIGLGHDTSPVASIYNFASGFKIKDEGWNKAGWVIWDEIQVGNTVGNLPGVTENDLVVLFSGFMINALRLVELESTSFDDFAANAGLTGDDALPSATPFNDGVPNLLKFAFNMNLAGPDSSRMEAGGSSGLPGGGLVEENGETYWRVEFVRRKNSGLTYIPQKSSSLEDDSFSPMTGEVTVTDIPGEPDWERVVIDEPCDPATEDRCFSRVRVDLP